MAVKLHIHVGDHEYIAPAKHLGLALQYADLSQRTFDALSRTVTHDDNEGHPFHGNQYVTVASGPKPNWAQAKGVKNKIHELLSSGHPFSAEELQQISGANLKQQVHNALNELKKGKGLHVEKMANGLYQVVNAQGIPAPAMPQEALAKIEEALTPPPEPEKPAEPILAAPEPTPEPVVAPPNVEKAPPAPPVKMTKAEADVVYKKQLNEMAAEAALTVDPMSANYDKTIETAAKKWKEQKAQAMADWATAVQGTEHKPKPSEVFQADKDLVVQLALAHEMKPELQQGAIDAAMQKWKEDTAKAKAAAKNPAPVVTPPKPAPEKPKAAVTPTAATVPTGGITQPKPEGPLVPEDHAGITVDDFADDAHGYSGGIAKLHKALNNESTDSQGNKMKLAKAIGDRLKDSHHFQNMEKQHVKAGKAAYGSLVSSLIGCWAGSSGGNNPTSNSAQLAALEVFGMNPDDVAFDALSVYKNHGAEETHALGAKHMGIDVSTPEKLHSYKEGMKDFLLAQYHNTQDKFKEMGIKDVYLIRGMHGLNDGGEAKHTKIKLQPMSSFSTNHGTALSFSGGDSVFAVKVPVSQVIGSYLTGYGCTNEHEVVVLNDPNTHAFRVVANSLGATKEAMINTIKKNFGSSMSKSTVAASKKVTGTSPFKFKNTVSIGAKKMNGKWKQKIQAAAQSDTPEALAQVISDINNSHQNLPASKAYAEKMHAEFSKQYAEHKEAQAQKNAEPPTTVVGGSKPQQKNSHYYKKLKAEVLGHPMHSEVTYTAMKNAGMSNEQVLENYKTAHAKIYGA